MFQTQCRENENLLLVQSQQYHHQSLYTRVEYLKLSEVETRSPKGNFEECWTREAKGCSSNHGMGKKNMSYMWNKNNTTTNPYVPELNTWNCPEVKTRSHCGTVEECKTREPEGTISNPSMEEKENLSQVKSEQYQHQSLCSRVEYMNMSEVKTRSHCGTVVECRTRDPEISSTNPNLPKKKISHRSNQKINTTNPSAQE